MAESYLEKALTRLARQLNAYDEASLMSLWEKYAERVRRFEPTKRWEESVIIFNMIQSMRFKNQLFNFNWAQSRETGGDVNHPDLAGLTAPDRRESRSDVEQLSPESEPAAETAHEKKKGKVLKLTPKDRD